MAMPREDLAPTVFLDRPVGHNRALLSPSALAHLQLRIGVVDLLSIEQPANEKRQSGLGFQPIADPARSGRDRTGTLHCPERRTLQVIPQARDLRRPSVAIGVDDA